MRVLIGVDGSSGSFEAVRQVGGLLSAESDQVLLYYSPPQISVRSGTAPEGDVVQRAQRALAESVFQESRGRLPEALQAHTEVLIGTQKPQHGLVVAAEERRADLIVVGARGVGPVHGLNLGSVGRAAVHQSPVPVLVVRRVEDREPAEQPRVLLACDDSEASQQAGQALSIFTWPPGSTGRVMRVMESMLVGQVPEWLEQQARDADTEAMARAWVEHHDQEKEEAREALNQYCQELPALFHGQQPILAEGHPSQQILRVIDEEKIDLVVVGNRGRGLVSRLLLGSTSEKVLTHAPCSVLVVRQHEKG